MDESTKGQSEITDPTVPHSPHSVVPTTGRVGQQLGNYQLVQLLGRGGFAEVYLGEHVHLMTQAAIKVLHAQLDSFDLDNFREEARIVARLRHPHIVSVHDFDVKDGVPFLVMDYAPNGSLRQRHPAGSIVSFQLILSYLTQVAGALDYAHERRLVHRDIKPENMLMGWHEDILLSDFGIAVMAQATQSDKKYDVIGTLAYMAPEQFSGNAFPASDQYALAVVVYEWLCGSRPFIGTASELAAQHVNIDPPPLSKRNPDVPHTVEQVVLKALAKDPKQRYPTVGDFARAFSDVCPQIDVQSRRNDGPVIVANGHHSSTTVFVPEMALYDPVPQLPAPKKPKRFSRRATLISLGGVAALGLSGGGLLWYARAHLWFASPAHSHVGKSSTPSATPGPQIGTILYPYHGHADTVKALAWSPSDGVYIASASKDHTVRVWTTSSGADQNTYIGHSDSVNAVTWSPDGQNIASASDDKTVQVWPALKGGSPQVTYTNHASPVNAVAWSPVSSMPYIASGGNDQTVRLWNPGDGSDVVAWSKHTDVIHALAWSPDGKHLASASADHSVMVWDASSTDSTAAPLITYQQHTDSVNAVAWSPDGKYIASASSDTSVQIWNALSGGNPIVNYASKHTAAVNAVAWSPDGKYIASGSDDGTVRVWQSSDGQDIFTYNGHSVDNTNPVYGVMWSPDGKFIASASADKTVQVWHS